MASISLFAGKKRLRNLQKHVAHIKHELIALRAALLKRRDQKKPDAAITKEIVERSERLLILLAGEEPGKVDLADIDFTSRS